MAGTVVSYCDPENLTADVIAHLSLCNSEYFVEVIICEAEPEIMEDGAVEGEMVL